MAPPISSTSRTNSTAATAGAYIPTTRTKLPAPPEPTYNPPPLDSLSHFPTRAHLYTARPLGIVRDPPRHPSKPFCRHLCLRLSFGHRPMHVFPLYPSDSFPCPEKNQSVDHFSTQPSTTATPTSRQRRWRMGLTTPRSPTSSL